MGKQLAITDNGVFVTGSKAFLTVDGVHRKVLKMFRTTDGVHRLCFSGGLDVTAMAISYTGNMTDQIVTMADGEYRLLTLTSSGTLTVDQEANADVWMCNGGTNGEDAGGCGGGGGYIASTSRALPLETVVVVGSGGSGWGGRSYFADICPASQSSRNYPDGASGGGAGGNDSYSGLGMGETTYPFGDTVYFAGKPHCAGGGGGGFFDDASGEAYHGGDGGSNSSDGDGTTSDPTSYTGVACGGAGGAFGGGDGASADLGSASSGGDASFYGCGGGGGSMSRDSSNNGDSGRGGLGYQGVIYVRIPLNQ